MDYKAFFNEIADWILQVNHMAVTYSMESDAFWNWVSQSIGEISKKYGNNPLVKAQLSMLFQWLDDVYSQSKKK